MGFNNNIESHDEDTSWHVFTKQSEKHPKITHLLI